MDETNQRARGLIASMVIVGAAKMASIVVGVVRMKGLSLLLGPSGVGLMGIFSSALHTGERLAGLGLGSSGVRQIAASSGDPQELGRVRRVLVTANLLQGSLGLVVFWLLREHITVLLFGDASRSGEVGLLGVGVLATLLASSQTALLQGMRAIGDLAKVTVISAIVSTAAGLGTVALVGERGVVWFLVLQPIAGVVVALRYTARLPRPASADLSFARALSEWKEMAALGVVFMGGGLLSGATLVAARAYLTRAAGLDEAGYFQAAWTVSMQYVGLLFAAMSADYYPRLASLVRDRPASRALVNDQLLISLALAGPVLIVLVGLAPWLLVILYSQEFAPATGMLQWQALGTVAKVIGWPVGFILVAEARSWLFLMAEVLWNAAFFGFLRFSFPHFGLDGAGIAFLVAYGAQVAFVVLCARRIACFRFSSLVLVQAATFVALAALTMAVARWEPVAGAMVGVGLGLVSGVGGLRAVLGRVGTEGRLTRRLARVYGAVGWPVRDHSSEP